MESEVQEGWREAQAFAIPIAFCLAVLDFRGMFYIVEYITEVTNRRNEKKIQNHNIDFAIVAVLPSHYTLLVVTR